MLNGLMITFLSAEIEGTHETNTIIITHAPPLVGVSTDESCSCVSSAQGRKVSSVRTPFPLK